MKMDEEDNYVPENILTEELLNFLPEDYQNKLKSWQKKICEEYIKQRAAAACIQQHNERQEEMKSQISDLEIKLQKSNESVNELRTQLDSVSKERTNLLESLNNHEREVNTLRTERNQATEDRDMWLRQLERQKHELERLQLEFATNEQQLKNAITAKCEAIARLGDIESKEASLELKEKRMEQERLILNNQIQNLSEDLNRTVNELQTLRSHNRFEMMQIETQLKNKTDEVRLLESRCQQLLEETADLKEELNKQNEESNGKLEECEKFINHLKIELNAKTKLAELYKGEVADKEEKSEEIMAAIAEHQRMLKEAETMYGELETKMKAINLKHQMEMEEKNKEIEELRAELNGSKELLKAANLNTLDVTISQVTPTAAIASRLMRSELSITQVYTMYVKATEELEQQKLENKRLDLQIRQIVEELQEKAPILTKTSMEYAKLTEEFNVILMQRDELMAKVAEYDEEITNYVSNKKKNERLIAELRQAQKDRDRQICYLLREQMELRFNPTGIADLTNEGSTKKKTNGTASTDPNDIISEHLVTYANVDELQEQNMRLLVCVRNLTTKLEEAEKRENQENLYKEKLENLLKKVQRMQETLNQQNTTVSTLLNKSERYKKLYFDARKKIFGNSTIAASDEEISDDEDDKDNENENDAVEKSKRQNPEGRVTTLNENSVSESQQKKRIKELEYEIEKLQEKYKTLEEKYEFYKKEKNENEKILSEQCDSLRTELRQLTTTNCQLSTSIDYSKNQIKLQIKNISAYKAQIQALEDRVRVYEGTIIKHEQSLAYLKDETMKATSAQSMAESELNQLRQENRILKDTATRLRVEKEGIHKQSLNQNLLLQNLELIKNNLERSESEGRQRLEKRLDEAYRDLNSQRLHHQEEQERFRELTKELQTETDAAKLRAKESETRANELSEQLIAIRVEISQKNQQIDELSKKLQESLEPSNSDNPIMQLTKKSRELAHKLSESKLMIESLEKERDDARMHIEKYCKISENAEVELKNLNETYLTEKTKLENEIKKLTQSNIDMKSKISELESELQLLNIPENSSTDQNTTLQLEKVQSELKCALQKLAENERNLRSLRADNTTLAENLNAVQLKYANEMSMHASDIQELSNIKAELAKIQDELSKFKYERDAAQEAYQKLKSGEDSSLEIIKKEKAELEERISDLNSLNANLHDQLESLSLKLSTISKSTQQNVSYGENSINDSAMDTTSGALENNENDHQSLLQIIKYLRKEREIANAKVDVLSAEKSRLQSELTILQKKVEELESFLKAERTKTDAGSLNAVKHETIMRKLETLNALNDSNRSLREERNSMFESIKKLNERIKSLEDELAPKQDELAKLQAKLNEMVSENTSLRTEAIKWRQRANLLVEKSNKNPEEFKRLQLERENLAKMLTNEKEMARKVNEELQNLRNDKSRLEQEIQTLQRQLQQINEEKRKFGEEFAVQKQNNARIIQEVMDMKNDLLQREETCQKLTEENNVKDAQLVEIRNKEATIRKIAKRYKDQYLELKTKVEGGEFGVVVGGVANAASNSQEQLELAAAGGGGGGGSNAEGVNANAAVANEQARLRTELDNLSKTIGTLQEENERMRKNSESFKASFRNAERSEAALRDAQARILSITEVKTAVEQELADIKLQLQNAQNNENSNHEAIIRQYEETIERMQREFNEQINANKEAHARLTRENEQLLMRISLMTRQIGGLQQSAKPSTSSVVTDKTCISETSSSSSSSVVVVRTANVKPMSGSSTAQQSATVTPWRGSETPLASIRPISVQNSRTAAVLPTSQQSSSSSSATGTSSTTTTSSTSTSSTSGTVGAAAGAGAATSATAASSNTALVPPQQVHTTGNSSIESMSASPTSSHTDYMPSTSSSASVAVAAIPPMGTTSAAESSQEAESVPQRDQQQNESQVLVSGGQQQVVALVSPRVEGAASASPNLQMQQDPNAIQQPSTSGTTSSTSHIAAVSSHSRHTPSSSNVTTTQAGHKRPRDHDGDSSTSAEEGGSDKSPSKLPKRLRTPMHSATADAVASIMVGETDADVEYQVPTSSQRDQEDEVHSVGDDDDDDEEDDDDEDVEEDDNIGEADDGPAEGENDDAYEDYEQDQDMDDGCAEVNESNIRCSVEADEVEDDEVEDGNEVEVEEPQQSAADNQTEASTSQAAAASAAAVSEQDQQQSRAVSSGSSDTAAAAAAIPQTVGVAPWKQASSSSQDDGNNGDDNIPGGSGSAVEIAEQGEVITIDEDADDGGSSKLASDAVVMPAGDENERSAEAASLDEVENVAMEENVECESHQSGSATQSEIQDIPQSEENADGVSSEGEKQAVEEMEEEGREAEASTSHSVNTRSRGTTSIPRSGNSQRRPGRGYQRGGNNRQPIVWGREGSPMHHQQQQQHQSVSPVRGNFAAQRQMRGRARARGRGNLSANYNNSENKKIPRTLTKVEPNFEMLSLSEKP